jgi:hypothetical protein
MLAHRLLICQFIRRIACSRIGLQKDRHASILNWGYFWCAYDTTRAEATTDDEALAYDPA